ncbi:putative membrane protein YhhN [Sphingomonas naasensis]|uniref:Lysoplasmalogenase n=1 Tax=Sphingomonas naasensis TaxID=1344951 RepID=A0A4S1WQZ0_9SPHN|nr:lysoplasmalogenase family protein [Sphingomonas naasensis]NIJ18518.1 putative membrane protein YhhN [Sphingomonas naasensis]TGX45771.1 lysoplasmalogenase [Sphingomonas naasensis]
MERRTALPIFLAALIAGASYYASHWTSLPPAAHAVWKGSGVGLLALWAATQARSTDGWLIAAALALGATGDVLLETHGLTVGAIAFLAGHVVASFLYLRNREKPRWQAGLIAVAVTALSWWLPADRSAAPGIALYAAGLGAMFGTAAVSRFSPFTVGNGAALFVFSDLLIFARLGPLATSELPGLLIWPTYFAGQALIAWGVVSALARERRA